MAQINGGRVLYGRTVKTGDYENKRVDVELSFSAGEGEDHTAIFDLASTQAVAKAHAILGLKADPVPATVKTETAATPKATGKKAAGKLVNPADLEPTKAADPTDLGDGPKNIVLNAETGVVTSKGTDVGGADAASVEDIFTAEAPPVTDKELMERIAKHNGKIKNASAIKMLIGKYVAPPGTASAIPANLRAKFLTELEALTGSEP